MANMNKLSLSHITLLSFILMFLSGCSSLIKNNHQEITEHQNINERTKKLTTLSDWKIKGKMGLISPKERHSLTMNWTYQGAKKRQTLNLTNVLGMQIFNLESVNGMHVIEVDGERYQGPDLNALLSSLTGLTLPTQAMTFWLKGLPYLANDEISYHQDTQLPQTLTSYFDENQWTVKYSAYQQVGQYQLATKFSIKQENFSIKINVYQWDVAINEQ